MPIAPQGVMPEMSQYIGEMIQYKMEAHDREVLAAEMTRREEVQMNKVKALITGEVGSVKQVTKTLANATALAFKQVTSEASSILERFTEADASLRTRSEEFRVKGNELDAKVNDGFTKIEEAIKEMRITGWAQATTGDTALARFDTLVAQAKNTHGSNLKDIVD